MTAQLAADLFKAALIVALKVAAPGLIAMLAASVLVGMLQAATQIQDSSVSFTPKIAAGFIVFMLLAPWMAGVFATFASKALMAIPLVVAR
ncbi:MAG: flagellar biosynthetic protein FliQ [Candidatus Binataceae bacterium]